MLPWASVGKHGRRHMGFGQRRRQGSTLPWASVGKHGRRHMGFGHEVARKHAAVFPSMAGGTWQAAPPDEGEDALGMVTCMVYHRPKRSGALAG
jgi:hypothetical protein